MKLTLGDGYLRPFELATLRLNNMIQILGNWEALAPTGSELLVQRDIVFTAAKRRSDDVRDWVLPGVRGWKRL